MIHTVTQYRVYKSISINIKPQFIVNQNFLNSLSLSLSLSLCVCVCASLLPDAAAFGTSSVYVNDLKPDFMLAGSATV